MVVDSVMVAKSHTECEDPVGPTEGRRQEVCSGLSRYHLMSSRKEVARDKDNRR